MSKIRCRNCKWWGHFDSGFRANCNRYPPYPIFTKLIGFDAGAPFIVESGALRPEPIRTHGDWDFCGEFEEGESIEKANLEEDARRKKDE
jgi:hypothetical protein